jgi:hypothetical protein
MTAAPCPASTVPAPGNTCAPNPCRGACCNAATLACSISTIFQCLPPNIYIPAATCVPNPCPGVACCRDDGSCIVVSGTVCPGGLMQAPGNTCSPNKCRGSCCKTDGSCIVTTIYQCPVPPNTYLGGTPCLPTNPCPQHHACCDLTACFMWQGPCPAGTIRTDGSCFTVFASACPTGTTAAPGNTCSPNNCPPPTLACCDLNACFFTTGAACPPGTTPAPGNTCTPNPCIQTVACCLPTGQCVNITSQECQAAGGTIVPICTPGILCRGACCCGSSCFLSAPGACQGNFQHFAGIGTVCNVPGNFATPCCKGDFNQNGIKSVQDLFDFLAAYFGGNLCADTNGSGTLSVQDLFDFLAAYFSPC